MGNINVMLVDDEERFLFTTKKMLERKGYKVKTASSGLIALEKLNYHKLWLPGVLFFRVNIC